MTLNTDHSKLIAFLNAFNALGKGLFEQPHITYKEDEDVLLVFSTCEVISALLILLHSRTADYSFYSMYGNEGPYLKCYHLPKFDD